MFGIGGGRWIRTTEVIDSRFTVCPLWPLGNSPIMTVTERRATFRYYCLMCAQPSSALTLTVYARLGLTLTVEKPLPANATEECYMPQNN